LAGINSLAAEDWERRFMEIALRFGLARRPAVQSAWIALLLAGLFATPNWLHADEPKIAWHAGSDLRKQLDQTVGVTWSGIPFRRALTSLSQSQRIAIMLDRRIDPGQSIELTSGDQTLDALLKLIARKVKSDVGCGIGWVGPVCYFGPEATAKKIRTLAALRRDDAMRLSKTARAELLKTHSWRWPDLAVPGDLLAALAAESQIEIQSGDRIPHDLWAAADLPAISFIDRLTLVAAQFDLTFEIAADGQSVKLVDMPESVELTRTYPLRGAQALQTGEIVSKLKGALPDATIEAASGKLSIRGRAEDQDFVLSFLSGEPAKKVTVGDPKNAQKRYQLTIVMAVGPLIKKLGQQMKLDVRIDEAAISAAGLSLDTKVDVSVKDVSADQLLRAVLDPAGLTFERNGNVISVVPAKKK